MFWCWLQEWLCTSADVVRPPFSSPPLSPRNNDDDDEDVDDDDDVDQSLYHLLAVCRTVIALHAHASDLTTNTKTPKGHAADDFLASSPPSSSTCDTTTITNNAYLTSSSYTNNNNNDDDNDLIDRPPPPPPPIVGGVRKAVTPVSLDLSNNKMKKRKISAPTTRSFRGTNGAMSDQLNEILEECEYDSDIGKFICVDPIDGVVLTTLTTATSSTESPPIDAMNDSGIVKGGIIRRQKETAGTVMKRIEFFEKNCVEKDVKIDETLAAASEVSTQMSSILCLATFVLTVLLLYFFPIPN